MTLTGSTAFIVENKALRARIEQLEAELAQCQQTLYRQIDLTIKASEDATKASAARIEQLEAANRLNAAQVAALRTRIKQLEAALRPFAEHGKPGVFGTLDVETPVSIVVEPHVVWLTDALKIWNFREALAALGEKE